MTTSTDTGAETAAEPKSGQLQPEPETGDAYKPEAPKRRHKTNRHVVVHGTGAGALSAAGAVLHTFGPTGLGLAAAGTTLAVGGAVALKNRAKKTGKSKTGGSRAVRTLTRRIRTQQAGGRGPVAGLRGSATTRGARKAPTAASATRRGGATPGTGATRPGARRGAGTGGATRRGPGGATGTAASRRARRAATARGARPGATGRPGSATGRGRTAPGTAAAKGASRRAATSRPARGTTGGKGGSASGKPSTRKTPHTRSGNTRPIVATRPARTQARRAARRAPRPTATPRNLAPKTTTPKAPTPRTSAPKTAKPPRPATNRKARAAAHTTRKRHVRYIKRAAAANPKTRNKPFAKQARAFAPEAKANVRAATTRKPSNSNRNNSRKTQTPRTNTRTGAARPNSPRYVSGPRVTPTPTVTVTVHPTDTTGYTVRPGAPEQTHTTIHLPPTRPIAGHGRPALTGRVISAPGTPTRSTPNMSNTMISSLTEAVRDHLGAWQPESANDILDMISGLQEFYGELGNAVVGVGEHLASDHPVDASVTEAIKQMGMATGQIGEYGREVHATFRAAHAEDLRRLEEPRAGEHEWNTDRNS